MKNWYAMPAVVLAAVAAKAARLRSLAVALNSPSSSEGAVPRSWSVNPTRLTGRNEPGGDALCLDSAFVSDDVHVVATLNKRHPRCVHGPRAGGIVPLIGRHRSRRANDQGVARMRVPACGSSRLPNIAQDIPVRQSFRLLQ